jgi:hypothetical protein
MRKCCARYIKSIAGACSKTIFVHVYEMEYDGEWTLSLDNTATATFILGNGKVGLVPSSSNLMAVESCYTSRPSDLSRERSLNVNTVPNIVSGEWTVAGLTDRVDSGELIDLTHVSNVLNMYNGTHANTLAGSDGIAVSITRYAVRHLPYCTMQTLVVTSGASYDLQIQHLVTLPPNDYRVNNFSFNGNLLSAGDGTLQNRAILIGDGVISDSGLPITVGVLYDAVDVSVSRFIGFQLLAKGGRDAGGFPDFFYRCWLPRNVSCSDLRYDGPRLRQPA